MDVFAQLEEESGNDDRRGSSRRRLRLRSKGSVSSNRQPEVVIHDLSESGLLIESPADLSVGEHLELAIPEAGTVEATVVWNDGRNFGCKFKEPISTAALSAALLQSLGFSGEEKSEDAISALTVPLRELRALSSRVDHICEQLEHVIDELRSSDRR